MRSQLLSDDRRNYGELKRTNQWAALRSAVESLKHIDLMTLDGRRQRTAFWINVYNGLVVEATVARGIKKSVMEVRDFFGTSKYNVGGRLINLEEIEHGILRANRSPSPGKPPPLKSGDPRLALILNEVDPRILFSLNCGARSCPPIRNYDPGELSRQLDTAARAFVGGPDVQIDRDRFTIRLSEIFRWYAEDFGAEKRSVLEFVFRHMPPGPDREFLEKSIDRVNIRYLPYDWSLPGALK